MLLQLQLQLLVGCSHFLKFESGFEITSRHVIKSRYKILGLARWDVPGGDARAGTNEQTFLIPPTPPEDTPPEKQNIC